MFDELNHSGFKILLRYVNSNVGNFVPTVNSVNLVSTGLNWQILFILLIHFEQFQLEQ